MDDDFHISQNVVISGIIADGKDSTEVWFCRTIDGKATNYGFMHDRSLIQNRAFSKSFYVQEPTVITIAPNSSIPKISLICDKGDSIRIMVKQDNSKALALSFEGSNAKKQEVFFKSPLFKGGKLDGFIDSVLQKATSLKDAVMLVENVKSSLLKLLDSLYQDRKISPSFYKLIQAQGGARYLSSISTITSHYLNNSDANGDKIRLNNVDLLELQRIMYSKYDPFSPEYNHIDQVLLSINVKNKCKLTEKGVLSGKKQDVGLWTRAAEHHLSFAPLELQHRAMAINLMFNRFYKSKEVAVDLADFILLKKNFPNSPYILFISTYFNEKVNGEKILPYTFAYYNESTMSLQVKETKDYKELPQLIKSQFPNRPVLIDVWATWCRPCKEEFSHANSLASFLKENKIALLYVSIDAPPAGEKWAKDIK